MTSTLDRPSPRPSDSGPGHTSARTVHRSGPWLSRALRSGGIRLPAHWPFTALVAFFPIWWALGLGSFAIIGFSLPMLLLGLLVAGFGLPLAGRRVRRSVYRPDPWRLTETLVAASGLLPAAVLVLTARVDPGNLYPSLDPLDWPGLPLGATLAVLVALLPAWLAPPPVSVLGPAQAVAA